MDKPDPSDKPTGPYMSPKLRDKLGDYDDRKDRKQDELPPWAGFLVLGLLVIAVAIVGMGIVRSNAEKKHKAEIAHADSLRAAAAAESTAAAMRDSLRADSVLTASASPRPTPRPTPAPAPASAGRRPAAGSTTAPAAAAPAAETRRYGLIVGEYLDEDRANSEKDRLAAATSLAGRVVSVDNGGAFRVILGSFEGRASAEKAAADLSSKGLVNEARVTALPR